MAAHGRSCFTHDWQVIGEATYVFLRSAAGETSAAVPGLKMGATQLLGHFVVDTAEQYEAATVAGAVEKALRGTRFEEPLSQVLARVAATGDGEVAAMAAASADEQQPRAGSQGRGGDWDAE